VSVIVQQLALEIKDTTHELLEAKSPSEVHDIKGVILLLEPPQLRKISGEELVEWHVVQGVVGIEGEVVQLLAFVFDSNSDGCCRFYQVLPRNAIGACTRPAPEKRQGREELGVRIRRIIVGGSHSPSRYEWFNKYDKRRPTRE